MSNNDKKKYAKFIYEGRQYPLELRLLQFFVLSNMVWALFNFVVGSLAKLPSIMTHMYLFVFVFLAVYWTIAYYFKLEKIFIDIYYIIYLISLPFMWYCAGGNQASANVLFICELVVFVMCSKGKKQLIYVILSILSSSALQAATAIVPGFRPLELTGREISMASRNIGLSTSVLVVAVLLKQKREYAKERDAAIKSEQELEKSNQLQKNFLANMSHEIRSPLGIVLGFNGLISESNNIEQIHEYSKNITKAGKTLHTVINDILDYSKIESGKLDIINDDYSYAELINEIKNDIGLKCSEKGLKFIIESDDAIPKMFYGDSIRIKQCLLNILSNAVKYTDKGTVTLKTLYQKSSQEGYGIIEFRVLDTGRGIKAEALPQLFDAFQRLEEGQNRAIEGTGLGLAITKNLIDEMHGSITVDSTYGVGSVFTIILEQKISDKQVGEEVLSSEEIDISGLNILVVDDTKMNLTLVNKLLTKEGVQVNTIDNGAACLWECKEHKYDLILLDHMMPEMDGIEVFKRLREEEGANKSTPVVMLTANAMAGANKEYEDLGFDGYLSKPISKKDLKEVIHRVAKRA